MKDDIFNLSGKTAVITGGLGQIGVQLSIFLVERGVKVAIIDKNLNNVSNELNSLIEKNLIKLFRCDITNKENVIKTSESINQAFGMPEILINNAALDSPPNSSAVENGPFEEYPTSSLDDILSVNVKGTFICCQIFGKRMAEKHYGKIINIASIYGVLSPNQDIYEYKRTNGEKWFKPAAYGMSKAAIINFTKYLATYWAKNGICINAISPAGIFNNQDDEFLEEYQKRIPIGRMANVNELNGAVAFLASDASSYITGINLLVDGGWTAW